MSREKQIKEIAKDLCQNSMCNHDDWCDCDLPDDCYCSRSVRLALNLYNKGYRKQIEGEWDENGRCTNCGWYMPFDSEGNAFETLYCPHCGADMMRKEHKENEKDT